MGGGDLNLKKSWHPSTLKNQEKVWKAQQQKAEEDKKIAQLQYEKKEERSRDELKNIANKNADTNKMDWMYKGPGGHLNREEYLLGRKIDKSFELLEKDDPEKSNNETTSKPVYTVEHEINPESVIKKDSSDFQIDIKRKLLEDPLLQIRQNEESARSQVTANPIKMQQLQKLLDTLKTQERKRKKKKRKAVDKKAKKKKKKKEKSKRKKKSYNSSSSSSSESEGEKSKSTLRADTPREKLSLTKSHNNEFSHRRKRSSEGLSRKRSQDRLGSERDGDARRSGHKRTSEQQREKRSKRQRSNKVDDESDDDRVDIIMARRREEMRLAALERDRQREANVRNYEKERELEERVQDMGHKFKSSYVAAHSVEERIRSKVGSSQRGPNYMEKFFVRK